MSIRLVLNAVPIAPGGGLSVLLGLLEGWREIGADLDIHILIGRASTARALAEAGYSDLIHALPLPRGLEALFWQRYCMPRLLRKLRAEVLLTNTFYADNCPCPQVVHHQNLFTLIRNRMRMGLMDRMRLDRLAQGARKALAKAEANVFLSDFMRSCAETIDPECRPRGHVIYNGLTRFYANAAAQPLSEFQCHSRTICAVQGIYGYKDTEVLLAALAELMRRRPEEPWQLKIAGGGDWRFYQELARSMNLSQRVQFLGHVHLEEVADLYRESICLVYPSLIEGFGLPVVEAMAWGCPVVATRATAIPEVAGGAAVLIEPHDSRAIVQAVERMLADEHFRENLRQSGKDRARQFSWTTSGQQFCRVFECLAGNSKPVEPGNTAA